MVSRELLHATDPWGRFIKTRERSALLAEIRDPSLRHGDAHLAVPVVHAILMTGDGLLRLVKRADKPENPHLWDKAMGGHVTGVHRSLPRKGFDDTLRRELAEELGIREVVLAVDALEFQRRRLVGDPDPRHAALLRLIDYDVWQPSICRSRDGVSWRKRGNVAVYAGVYDGEFEFLDGEAEAECRIDPDHLKDLLRDHPETCAPALTLVMERYLPFLVPTGRKG